MIAADSVAKAAPDAYTLLLTDDGVLTTVSLFQEKMPYDTERSRAGRHRGDVSSCGDHLRIAQGEVDRLINKDVRAVR